MIQVVEQAIDRLNFLEPVSDALQKAGGKLLQSGGEPAKRIKDVLNGVWFEHPLHPAVTDVPIGAWTCSTLLDLASAGDRRLEGAADTLVGVGCLGAAGAALTGLADWYDTYGKERRTGITHALLNTGALGLFVTSFSLRKSGRRAAGICASMAGYGLALLASYLGGDLVFRFGTQVNRTAWPEYPAEWTAVLPDSELAEGKLACGKAGELPVMLARQAGRVYAMYDICPHAGGPLHEGTLEDRSVICPWHGSKFDLANGAIYQGPSSYKPPLFETRVSDGQIEVRYAPRLG